MIKTYMKLEDYLNNDLSSDWLVRICTSLNEKYGTDYVGDISAFSKALMVRLNAPKAYLWCYEELDQKEIDAKLLCIVDKYVNSIEDYKAMYEALNTELNVLKNKTTIKFNDTPTEEGNFSTDKYTSTITTQESEAEYSIGDKINLLNKRLRNLVETFCKQFEGYIIWTI